MKQIYKYEIPNLMGISEIEIPTNDTPYVEPLSVANQNNKLVLYTQVDLAKPVKTYKILSVLTGGTVPEDTDDETYCFLGTVMFDNGAFVVHVFLIVE